jgi:hypothetical protein
VTHTFGFAATLWEYDGSASWFFVSVPNDVADEIADLTDGRTGGFGSVRVHVRAGSSRWSTSLFPSKQNATYVLPVKKSVRIAESLDDGDIVDVEITLA